MSAMNAAAAAGAACTAPRVGSASRRTRASLPSNARVRAKTRRGASVTLRTNASETPARSARRGELQRANAAFQGGYADSDDDYDPPGSTRDVIDRDAAMSDDDDDVDRRPAAPGMLQRMRREATPWYRRIGSNAWCAIALAVAVLVWNLPQALAGGGFFHALAPHVPALAPVADAIGKFAHLGVGFNPRVAVACTTATFKIVALCLIIGRLMRSNTLPRETPVVLSKLAFNVLLPAYMCTRVAATLHSTPLTLSLAALPVSAVLFVVLGGACGALMTWACSVIPGVVSRTWYPALLAGNVGETIARSAGLPPDAAVSFNPAPGIPAAVVKPYAGGDVDGRGVTQAVREDPMNRVAVAASAFGNTFTLPLVFLVEVLGASYGDRIAGYIALYLIGWSPALWTFGYLLLTGGGEKIADGVEGGRTGSAFATCRKIVRELINPPLVGICLGVLIGVTPLRHALIGGTAGSIAPAQLPAELAFIAAVAKALFELGVLIGGAALPGQTLVLASSFVKILSPEEAAEEERRRGTQLALCDSATHPQTTTLGLRARRLMESAASLFKMGESDLRALFIASVTRFAVLPAIGVVGFIALRLVNSPWYPRDPIVALVVLTMICMPSAQNLVLLTNLREETRPLAPRLAGLLLRMYVLAIPFVTVWLTVFTAAMA